MPINFIDNYSKQNLSKIIVNQDGNTLFGELWVYEQFLSFNENKYLEDETWYIKHNYNLASHPASKKKVEGQVDFIILSKYGILILEVKGGGLRVNENDCYYTYNKSGEYESQNPFVQAKEYVHTLKNYIDSKVFVYRAVILPHEAGFELKGPQLEGYNDIFFSKANFDGLNERAIQNMFFDFIYGLNKNARIRTLKKSYQSLNSHELLQKANELYPLLNAKELKRLKSELFPVQSTYGYNPDKINKELICKENYEILKGLRKNRNIIIQGGPGTGKTALAIKYLAESLLKQQKGVIFCANLLIKSKLEHIIIHDYELDPNNITFRIYSATLTPESIPNDIDFLIFDEAQEYFDKGLYDFICQLNVKLGKPKLLVLYDPDQAIISNINELEWYTDFFIEMGYSHFYFDENYRSIQNKNIIEISNYILFNDYSMIKSKFNFLLSHADDSITKLAIIKEIIKETKFTSSEKIILVESHLIDEFAEIVVDYFKTDIEEVTETNINIPSIKIRYTTPIKYRGLENESVYLITKEINDVTKVQNYVGATRAMNNLKIILWK
jgi:hypothetical protein